ncbi:MAG: filamentous hemagglutinin N-terminal domain-containing protein [Cyanobacteria bacterium P01_G01_bin.67]
MQKSLSLILTLSCFALGSFLVSRSVTAQEITADGTTNTTIESDGGGNFTIEQGDRAGNNLFHSFSDFSVPTNGSALFDNGTDISNIFSRVTGGNISNIDGLIQANGSANLFLVNPAGILFGNNARLDIGGSFLGTTADSILFEDGLFSATDLDNPPLLTVNAPIGLNFRDNSGDIVNTSVGQNPNGETNITGGAGGLQVPEERTLALVGGNVLLDDGNLTAKGGHIEIGSVLDEGEVKFSETELGLSFDYESINSFGDITLQNTSVVDVNSSNGGSINVHGNNLTISDSSLNSGIASGLGTPNSQAGDINIDTSLLSIIDGGSISTSISGQGNGGKIIINSDDSISLGNQNGSGFLVSNINFDAIGNSGGIEINTGSLTVENASQITSQVFGMGNSGNITLQANESILIDGITENNNFSGVFNEVGFGAIGNAGTITVIAANLSITNGAQISTNTFGQGNGGNLTIDTTESVLIDDASNNPNALTGIFNQVAFGATGNAGSLEISTTNLSLINNALISSSTFGIGNGGSIAIEASELIALENSQISSNINNGSIGDSGSISITTKNLALTDGAIIEVGTFGEGNAQEINISATEQVFLADSVDNLFTGIRNNVGFGGTGDSGGITINANSLSVNDGVQIQSSIDGTGNSGEITINADLVEFSGRSSDDFPSGAFSSVDPDGEGNAGGINITANQLIMSDRAQLSSSTEGVGNAGDVNLQIADQTTLLSSSIISEVSAPTEEIAGGFGEGGDINITTGSLLIKDGSSFLADTENVGNAGDINIEVNEQFVLEGEGNAFFADFGITSSQISTTVEQQAIGDGGSITISTPSLLVQDTAFISASNFGQGEAGIIDITAENIDLENEAAIVAETFAGAGGNIFFQIEDNLTLGDNSLISAQAFGNADGGNVNIDTNFLVAFPNETPGDGSDITASAEAGDGGNISISAESLLGIEEGIAIEGNGTNEIDASSEFGLDGTISIFSPDINPIQGATELPSNVVEPDQAVAQACNNNRNARTASSFVLSGKGGIPPAPHSPLNSEMITVNGATTANSNQGSAISTSIGDITLARGIIKTAEGRIVLTATPVSGNASRLPNSSLNCS